MGSITRSGFTGRPWRQATPAPAATGEVLAADLAAAEADAPPLREPSSLEPWLWGLGVFLLTSPFVFQLTGTDPSQELTRSLSTFRRNGNSGVLLYVVRFVVMSFAVMSVLPFWRLALARVGRLWPILLFFAWATLSLTWTDTFPSTLNGLLALLPLLTTGFCLALRLPPHLFARSFVCAGVFMAGFSLLYIFGLPHFGIHQQSDAAQSVHAGAWRGVYPHKNIFGGVCGAFAVMTILSGRRVIPSLGWQLAQIALLLALIVKSSSATALTITAIAPLIAIFVVCFGGAIRGLVLVLLFPLAFGIWAGLDAIFKLLGRDMTFTGRTEIWSIVPETVARRPLTGYGFASTTYGDFMIQIFKRFALFDPHNGYLNLVLSTGFVGLALFLASIYSTGRVARRMFTVGGDAAQGGLVMFGVLAAWLVACSSESQDKPLGSFAALGFTALGLMVYRELRPEKPRV